MERNEVVSLARDLALALVGALLFILFTRGCADAEVNTSVISTINWDSNSPSNVGPTWFRVALVDASIDTIAGRSVCAVVAFDGVPTASGVEVMVSRYLFTINLNLGWVDQLTVGQTYFGRELNPVFLAQARPLTACPKTLFSERGIMASGSGWRFGWDVGVYGGNGWRPDSDKNVNWIGHIKCQPVKTLVLNAAVWGGPRATGRRKAGIFGFQYNGRVELRSETSWVKDGDSPRSSNNYVVAIYKGSATVQPVVAWEDDVIGDDHQRSYSVGCNLVGKKIKLLLDVVFGDQGSKTARAAIVSQY